MPIESHLISIKDSATPSQVESILKTLINMGGRVDLVAKKSIIATFNGDYAEVIKRKPGVRLVGGVNFKGRNIRKVVKQSSSGKSGSD